MSKSESTEKKEKEQKFINEEIIGESLYKILYILKGLKAEAERQVALEDAEAND